MAGFCAHGIETLDFIKCFKFVSEEGLYCLKLVEIFTCKSGVSEFCQNRYLRCL